MSRSTPASRQATKHASRAGTDPWVSPISPSRTLVSSVAAGPPIHVSKRPAPVLGFHPAHAPSHPPPSRPRPPTPRQRPNHPVLPPVLRLVLQQMVQYPFRRHIVVAQVSHAAEFGRRHNAEGGEEEGARRVE